MRLIDRWKDRARHLTREVYALYWACRHPRAPWYAKVFVAGLVAYAFSPIDLIPDFIPVLGYLDELILLPTKALRRAPNSRDRHRGVTPPNETTCGWSESDRTRRRLAGP